ncbi:TEA/ATTS domain family-domain-containing protein [Geopyxis carbonaria]|nr:TEA/ATTS domain family-domain-containing protein [Geopyxis carbonaria]
MPYRQYRARQRRDLPSGRGASVWDEELEAAFMEAIQKIPKIGRRKLPMEGKPCGRNELISEYIYKVTGVKRDRKQVSSHIQVLKGLLRNNPDFMKHVTTVEQPSSWEAENNQWDMETGSPSAQSEPTPCMNSRPLPRNRANTSGPLGDYYGTGFVSPPPSASQSSFQFTAPGLEITAFEMSAGISNSGIIEDCFHTYTKLAHQESIQQMAVHLDVIPAWRTRFPHVAELVENEDLNPNCTILHASTSIALLSSSLPSDAQLRTLVEVSIPSSAVFDNHTWECVTRIYAPGKKVWELSHPNVPQANDLDGTCKLKLPFASDFWSAFYTSLSAANQQQGGDGHDGNLKRRREKDARDAIKGITVVQELFSTALGGLGVRERSAIIMWEFTKTSGNAPGKAVWREITPFASSPSMIPQSHGMPVTTVVSLDGTELLSAVKPEHTNSWQTQYPPNIPMSPYEDPELSPSAIAHPYYTFDSNNSSAYTTAENTASVNALLASDMNMGFYPQQHHDQHQQGTYAPFVPNISGLTGAGHGEVDQYLGVGTGAAGSGGDNWPQQHQHLSPVSEAQDHGYVDLGF